MVPTPSSGIRYKATSSVPCQRSHPTAYPNSVLNPLRLNGGKPEMLRRSDLRIGRKQSERSNISDSVTQFSSRQNRSGRISLLEVQYACPDRIAHEPGNVVDIEPFHQLRP